MVAPAKVTMSRKNLKLTILNEGLESRGGAVAMVTSSAPTIVPTPSHGQIARFTPKVNSLEYSMHPGKGDGFTHVTPFHVLEPNLGGWWCILPGIFYIFLLDRHTNLLAYLL